MTAENGCLRRALEEAEEKMQKKQGAAEAIQSATILGKPSEMAAAKIIELSKRCREQTAEIEVLKSKCKSLEIHVANKEAELESERRERVGSKAPDSSQESELHWTLLINEKEGSREAWLAILSHRTP